MIDFLKVTLVAARQHAPDAEIRIIPFDDNLALTRELAPKVGATVIEPHPYWDRVGQHFYGRKEYRPGVPSFRYFRKFNVFNGRPEQFLFFDANMAILASLDPLFKAYHFETSSLVFGHLALPRQFVDYANEVMRELNPAMNYGYGCASFMGRGDAVPRRDSNILVRNQNWAKLFDVAPEQAFISALSAITGSPWTTYSKLLNYGRSNMLAAAFPRQLREDGNYYFLRGELAGKISHFCKWNGAKMASNAGSPKIYEALRAKASDYLKETA